MKGLLMKKRLLLLLLPLLFFWACTDDPETVDTFKYAALGASDAVGVGATPDSTSGYVYVISDSIKTLKDNVAFNNFGVSGAVAEEIHHEQVSKAINAQADVVTVWVGGNDAKDAVLYGDFDLVAFNLQVDSIFSKLRSGLPNALIVTANLPDFGKLPIIPVLFPNDLENTKAEATQATIAVNKIIADAAAKYQIEMVDLYTKDYIADPTTVCDDGFHPSTKGYKLMADEFFAVLKEELL